MPNPNPSPDTRFRPETVRTRTGAQGPLDHGAAPQPPGPDGARRQAVGRRPKVADLLA